MALPPLSAAWALNVRTVVVDLNPMVSLGLSEGFLDKTIDYFTSTADPSIMFANYSGGIYLYNTNGSNRRKLVRSSDRWRVRHFML